MSETLESTALIIAPRFVAVPVPVASHALVEISEALAMECLLGRVTNAEENQRAVNAQATQNAILRKMEKARKESKAPFIEMGRLIDKAADEATEELKKECGRLNSLTVPWGIQERRRLADEAEAQRKALKAIEDARLAEIKRLSDEQAAREAAAQKVIDDEARAAREAQEAADRAAREATNKKQRDAALAAQQAAATLAEETRLANLKRSEETRQQAISTAAAVEQAEERAGSQAYFESRPIIADTAKGQKLAKDWIIVVDDVYKLAKYHPSCVTIKALEGQIKNLLREGVKVEGVTATETVNTAVRAKRERPAIEA